MLKLNPEPTFKADVPLTVPGEKKPVTVSMTFRYKNRKELIDYVERLKDRPMDEALSEIIAGWDGIDAECNQESITALTNNYQASGHEIFSVYRTELIESRIKN